MDANDLVRRINDNLHWSHVGANKLLDVWEQIEALWSEPNESFVAGLYLVLLGRQADPKGKASWCGAMATGMKRADVVRSLALSDEARTQNLDVTWLSRLDGPPCKSSLAFLRKVFWRLTAVRPRGVWRRVKNQLRRMAS
jgi:hypothetical protein